MKHPPRARNFSCMDCKAPNSALRNDSRCTECAKVRRLEIMRAWHALYGYQNVKRKPPVVVKPILKRDMDVELYRIVKAQRREEVQANMAAIKAVFDKEMEMWKPQRGRPRTDYGKRKRAA